MNKIQNAYQDTRIDRQTVADSNMLYSHDSNFVKNRLISSPIDISTSPAETPVRASGTRRIGSRVSRNSNPGDWKNQFE